MHGTIRFCMSIPMEGTSKKRGRKQRPSPKRILHFLLQNLRDEFAHPLPQPLLQTLPPGIPLLLVRARCRATVRHGVSSCGRDLQQRDPGFVFNDFSGAYAFHFSTGIGTEPGAVGVERRRTVNAWLKVNPVNGQDYTSLGIYTVNRKASEQIF